MAPQSLAQLAHGPMGRELLDELMADLSTVIVTPGSGPFDATYFADLFGQEPRPQASWSYEAHGRSSPGRAQQCASSTARPTSPRRRSASSTPETRW
jgi:hypothetical protein